MAMKLISRIAVSALALTGVAIVAPQAAHAGCTLLSGTADGLTKQQAVTRSRAALNEYVVAFKKRRGMRNASISPAKAPPNPYWRKSVARNLYLKPDVRTRKSHTVCWEGVISPAVCTSGAKLCTGGPRPAAQSPDTQTPSATPAIATSN
jgi:hypothetical protein